MIHRRRSPAITVFQTAAVCLILAAFLSVPAEGATRYVSKTGNNVWPYTNQVDAAVSINDAVGACVPGDLIRVDDGTYILSATITIDNPITVQSVNGPAVTIISGNNAVQCLVLDSPTALIDGFTITGGQAVSGGGIYCNAGGIVTNCLITGNTASFEGGGIYCNANSLVVDCTITENYCGDDGAGVCCNYGGIVENCVITANNSADKGGGVHCRGGGTIRGCLITGNTASWFGGGVYCKLDGPVIENCTVVDNTADLCGGVYFYEGGTLRNTISYFNNASGGEQNWYNTGAAAVTTVNNCTTPLLTGDGNTAADPEFVDRGTGNYQLLPGSPCLDSGTNQAWMAAADDIEGNSRILNVTVDMGAYEHESGALACNFIADTTEGFMPLPVTFTVSVEGTNLAGIHFYWDFDNDGTPDLDTDSAVTTNIYDQPGIYSVSVLASNTVGETDTALKIDYIEVGGATVYVSRYGTHEYPYSDWATAATNLHAAIDAAVDGTAIQVSNGTYTISSKLLLSRRITLTGVNGSFVTTIQADGSDRCIEITDPDALVVGFTLTGGYADTGAGAYLNYGGTLMACIVSNNVATDKAGGVFCYGGGTVQNCAIIDNTAGTRGGGVFCRYGGTLINCMIAGNSSGLNGGGVRLEKSASVHILDGGTLRNCTVANNSTDGSGGGICCNYGGVIENTIVYHNTAAIEGDNYFNEGAGMSYSYSCTTPLISGTGIITDDPAITPTLLLTAASPCIDAGTDVSAPPTDIHGEARWDHPAVSNIVSAVDIGADEFVDTDLDNMADYWETALFGDVTNRNGTADGDLDMLDDLAEYNYGTDPDDPDTDNDQMPDGWEVTNNTDALVADADGDPDSDAFPNYSEYIAGTLPNDASSLLDLGCDQEPTGTAISWETALGRLYTLYSKTNMLDLSWTSVAGYFELSGTGNTMGYTNSLPKPREFYKVGVQLDSGP